MAIVASFALVFVALFGERLAPHEPIYFVVEHGRDPRPYDPGVVFPLGSDVLGRDLLSLVLAGARATLMIVLLAGVARVAAGVLIAALGSWWRPTRLATESLAELASAVPATLVALVVVKVFVRADTSILVFVGALLLMGWAGPYRVIRAEVDRLARAPFTEGARAIGVSRWRLFWRHQVPPLVPVISTNLSQQVVAALVLVAELGVLGAFVGTTRVISVEESLTAAPAGTVDAAQVADPPEWGGLLAASRTVEALWVTRWLILVPGLAFALTALAISVLGFALARRYAKRDLLQDLRGPGSLGLAAAVAGLILISGLVPERYAAAREWATSAREQLREASDVADAFGANGLRPLGAGYAVRRDVDAIRQTAAASVVVGSVTVAEPWPRTTSAYDPERIARAFVTGMTGGGVVEAPLVFASRGISTADYKPERRIIGLPYNPGFGQLIRDYRYADDYDGIDVRGKVVLLVRPLGIKGPESRLATINAARGPLVEASIANAVKRGAAAVIFVDPALTFYTDVALPYTTALGGIVGGPNPYTRAEEFDAPMSTSGVPVMVLSEAAALTLVRPLGIDLLPLLRLDERGDERWTVSLSRDLGVTARVEVPLRREIASVTSYAGELSRAPNDAGRILIWAVRRPEAPHPPAAVLAALARALREHAVPFVLVDFDPSVDARANAKSIRSALGDRRISLVVVLDQLDGEALRLATAHGDLIPALDLYAERAGTRYQRTLTTARAGDVDAPFVDVKTVLIRGTGGEADRRADAAALLAYLAGRHSLGAEEVAR